MLSNKLTFSLVLVLMLVAAFTFTGVVDAQTSDITVWGADATFADNAFVVVAKNMGAVKADNATDDGVLEPPANVVQNRFLPDLAHFFNSDVDIFGGTLEVLVKDSIQLVGDDPNTAKVGPSRKWNDIVVTEIMWGHDQTPADPADPDPATGDAADNATESQDAANKQWVELYNNSTGSISYSNANQTVVLRFWPDQYVNNDMYYAWADGDNDGVVDDAEHGQIDDVPSTRVLAALPDHASDAYYFYKVVDRVSNMKFARWALPGSGGNTQVNADFATTNSLRSAYRKAELNSARTAYKEASSGVAAFEDGTGSGGWVESIRRKNIRGPYVATPGSSHVYEQLGGTDTTKTEIPSNSIVINEFRNDPSDANLDWIELYNRGTDPVDVNAWQISFVTGAYMQTNDADPQAAHYDRTARDSDYLDLPERKIPAGGYLLIVNAQPHDTPLGATGTPLAGSGQDGKGGDGAKHQYHVDTNLDLPNVDHYLIILRSAKPNFAKGTAEDAFIQDIAGRAWNNDGEVLAAFQDTETFRFNTDIWPLKGLALPSAGDLAKYDKAAGFKSASKSWARVKYDKDKWYHKDSWAGHGEMDGVGYDRHVNLGISPGTPGYANTSIGKKADIKHGAISISEIMWDAGPRLDLVQWIELYNSSPSETISLDGWSLEIRNKDDDDIRVSPVDAIVPFKNAPQILPNRTLLIVSAAGPSNIESDNHIYNLSVENKDDLRLRVRRDVLLSEAGFYIALMDKDKVIVDIAGNLSTSRKSPKVLWELKPKGIEDLSQPRKSMRRLYGKPKVTLGRLTWEVGQHANGDEYGKGMPRDGQGLLALERLGQVLNTVEPTEDNTDHLEAGWLVSDLQGTTHYGHPNDYGNPGYRRGGPLPVSLSSFRPTRDKATGAVVIRWVTESELNNAGFNILRSETKNGQFKVVNVRGIVPGHGTTSEKHVYEWKDTTAKPNVVYYYQIEDVSLNGKRTTLATTHLRGNVNAAGKLTTTWGDLKTLR